MRKVLPSGACCDALRPPVQAPDGPLAETDISGRALEELRRSAVEEVHIIGRRGIAQVKEERRARNGPERRQSTAALVT